MITEHLLWREHHAGERTGAVIQSEGHHLIPDSTKPKEEKREEEKGRRQGGKDMEAAGSVLQVRPGVLWELGARRTKAGEMTERLLY